MSEQIIVKDNDRRQKVDVKVGERPPTLDYLRKQLEQLSDDNFERLIKPTKLGRKANAALLGRKVKW